jgi:hypothetical protein
MSAYLTKSKFVHALDCPTKFYYHENEEYKSKLGDDEFLQALAEGGLQVGELAKLYFPGRILFTATGRNICLMWPFRPGSYARLCRTSRLSRI